MKISFYQVQSSEAGSEMTVKSKKELFVVTAYAESH